MKRIRSAGYERSRSFTVSCNRLDEVSKVKRLPHVLSPVLSSAYLPRFYVTSMVEKNHCYATSYENLYLSIDGAISFQISASNDES